HSCGASASRRRAAFFPQQVGGVSDAATETRSDHDEHDPSHDPTDDARDHRSAGRLAHGARRREQTAAFLENAATLCGLRTTPNRAPLRLHMIATILVFLGTFLSSAVEAVEALTSVLAVGVVRGWRSTLIGVGAAALTLGAIVAVLGPALQLIPIGTLRFVVGALLLAFGLQWLRKAILRAAGYRPQRDEAAAFKRERAQAAP